MEDELGPGDQAPSGGDQVRLVLGSDHAGLALRNFIAGYLIENGHEVAHVGAMSTASYDYPDAADAAIEVLKKAEADLAILICGSGIGISIRANRHHGIRAALCTTEYMARVAREHNHANVLCLGERVLGTDQAASIVQAFLAVEESENPRHLKRVEKLDAATAEN